MNNHKLKEVDKLINSNKINEAQAQLAQLGSEYFKNSEYLYLRSKIFFINKLYYVALDTLLIALEFEKNEKVYALISKIYNTLGNKELEKKIANPDLRSKAIISLKNELTGISQKGYEI